MSALFRDFLGELLRGNPSLEGEDLLDAFWLASRETPSTPPDEEPGPEGPVEGEEAGLEDLPPEADDDLPARSADETTEQDSPAENGLPEPEVETGDSMEGSTTTGNQVAGDAGCDIYGGGIPSAGADGNMARAISLAGSPAIGRKLDFDRALRPLRKSRASKTRREIDEEATVEAIVETGIWNVVEKPKAGRWLDVAIVVEHSPTMGLWQATGRELPEVIARGTRARSVSLCHLRHQREGLSLVTKSGGRLSGPLARQPGPGGLVLLLSDCFGTGWLTAEIPGILRTWAARKPVVVLQVLPPALWHQTSLRGTKPDFAIRGSAGKGSRHEGLPLLSHLDPKALFRLGSYLSGSGSAFVRVISEAPSFFREAGPADLWDEVGNAPPDSVTPEDALALCRQFEEFATAEAVETARYLAGAPLVLPVMRLVQRVLVPDAAPWQLAEIFQSGILLRAGSRENGDPPQDPENAEYEFLPGLREYLWEQVGVARQFKVIDLISRYLDDRMGMGHEFLAWVTGGEPAEVFTGDEPARSSSTFRTEMRAFAHIGRFHAARLGILREPAVVPGTRRETVKEAGGIGEAGESEPDLTPPPGDFGPAIPDHDPIVPAPLSDFKFDTQGNHLVIGLGGTGGKVIRNIRKAIYRDWRPSSAKDKYGSYGKARDKVAEATPPGLELEYLYVDSSRENMGSDDPEWKILGENLQLDQASQCHLKGLDPKAQLDDIHSYPALAPWIGSSQDLNPVFDLRAWGSEIHSGQNRRLGRLLFANNAADFMGRVNHKANVLRTGSSRTAIVFHVVCGLAGGTGSGSLIDAISLLRNEYPDSQQYPIILYLLLPDDYPKNNWNTGNYHANGYAALMELNSLGVGDYLPYNLLGHGERHAALPDPFKICYLITNENSNGALFEVHKQIPEMMAELIYQKIVASHRRTGRPPGRIAEWENMEISHEGRGRKGKAARCRRFASFGIKKISYPEEEIRDYIGYLLSEQTLNQMLYNHWSQGYLDVPLVYPVEGFVADPVTQKAYNLDRQVFFLERQFSSEDGEKDQETWKSHEADWRGHIERLAGDVQAREGNWLDMLWRKCGDREENSFRDGRGIVDYFVLKRDRIPEYARIISSAIERQLATGLVTGERSLTEIEAILRSLCVVLGKKCSYWDRESQDAATVAARERAGWMDNLERFSHLGILARLLPGGRKQNIFHAGKEGMIVYYSMLTTAAAGNFAVAFAQRVRDELAKSADHVAATIASFKSAAGYCESHAAQHRPEEVNQQSTEVIMRLFNGDEVKRHIASLIRNRDLQDQQARQTREKMVEMLMSGRVGLRTLPTQEHDRALLDILAQSSHATLVALDASATESGGRTDIGRLLSVSIIDKLKERYSGNTDLMKKEIRDHMSKVGYLLKINDAEAGKKGPGTDFSYENKKESLIVMMPGAESDDDFVWALKVAFSTAVGNAASVQFIDTKDSRRHEITILNFVQLFPLRYADALGKLKEKYEGRLKEGNPRQRVLEIHTEGSATSYPALFVPPVHEIAGPALLLALALGTARPKSVNGVPGTLRDSLVTVDEDDVPIDDLGVGFESALRSCSQRDILDRISDLNLAHVRRRLGDSPGIERVSEHLKELATEVAAGNDYELGRTMGYANSAISEFEGLLQSSRAT